MEAERTNFIKNAEILYERREMMKRMVKRQRSYMELDGPSIIRFDPTTKRERPRTALSIRPPPNADFKKTKAKKVNKSVASPQDALSDTNTTKVAEPAKKKI